MNARSHQVEVGDVTSKSATTDRAKKGSVGSSHCLEQGWFAWLAALLSVEEGDDCEHAPVVVR
jgi:hypothetical protein